MNRFVNSRSVVGLSKRPETRGCWHRSSDFASQSDLRSADIYLVASERGCRSYRRRKAGTELSFVARRLVAVYRARQVVRVFRVVRAERGSLGTHHGTSFKSTLGRGELHHGRHAPRGWRLRLLLGSLIGANETPDRSGGGNTIMTAEVHNSYAKQVRGLVRGKNNSPSANHNFSEILPRTEPRRRLSARAFAVERPINNNFKIKPSHVLYMEKVKARCIRRALTFV